MGPLVFVSRRRLGAGPGVAGSVAEFRESGGRLRSQFGDPEAKKEQWKMLDLSATLVNSWPPDCNTFLSLSRVSIWSFAAWSATSQLPIGIFLGINLPMSRPILDAKNIDFGEIFPILNVRSWNAPGFARFCPVLPGFARQTDVNGCAPGPTYHAPDTRMT